MTDGDGIYNEQYYAHHCGQVSYDRSNPEWRRFFGNVADQVMKAFQPNTMFDAGCAHGFLMEEFYDRGVEVAGRDISHFALSQVRPDIRNFTEYGTLTAEINGSYDIITCIEVLEHMTEDNSRQAIHNICSATNLILFSSSPDDFDEPSHINVRPTLWWLQRFADAGFAPLSDYSADYLTWHAFFLHRESEPIASERLMVFAQELANRAVKCASERSAHLQREVESVRAELSHHTMSQLGASGDEVSLLHRRLHAIETSSIWRATAPLRALGETAPPSLRQAGRYLLRCLYWISTPRSTGKRLRYLKDQYSNGGVAGVVSLFGASVTSVKAENYAEWVRQHDTLSNLDRRAIVEHITRLSHRPLISIIVPVYNAQPQFLREMIASVKAQLYQNWELCIADDASSLPEIIYILTEQADGDPRIKWVRRERNGNISAASNTALGMATGTFLALLDHDDVLAETALYEVAVVLNAHPDAELIYSDEDKIDGQGRRYDPYFKPDFSYDLLLGQNFISHLGVYRRDTVVELGGFKIGMEGSQDYDLVLRLVHSSFCSSERTHHIPAVLYHWRQDKDGGSFSQAQRERCVAAARQSIANQLAVASSGAAEVLPNPKVADWTRIRWPIPTEAPLVSIIIPTRDRSDLMRQCVDGLLRRTSYRNFEVIVVDNGSVEEETLTLLDDLRLIDGVKILKVDGEFNYSRLNNKAAELAGGDVLLLLNNDVDVIEEEWLTEMVSLVSRDGVAAVGAKLLYADGRIQHAGVRLGGGHFTAETGIAAHSGHLLGRHDPGYFGHLILTRDVSAVTGACLAVRKDVFLEVGGFNEKDLKVAFNDVDLCLRIRAAGYRILWTPFAELYHYESASRGSDMAPDKADRFLEECKYMLKTWKNELMSDPFYNVNLESRSGDCSLSYPPRRLRPWAKL